MDNIELKKVIGNNIRKKRLENGYNLDDLAEHLKITPSYLSLIENGKCGTNSFFLKKTANIFDCLIHDFFIQVELPPTKIREQIPTSIDKKRKIIEESLEELDIKELEIVMKFVESINELIQLKK